MKTLIALSETERSLFFADPMENLFPGAPVFAENNETNGGTNGETDGGAWRSVLLEERPKIILTGWSTPMLPIEYIRECGKDLPYVCHVMGSIRHVVPRRFLELGGLVSNWGNLACDQVAEHALLLALSALRNTPLWGGYLKSVNGSLRYPAAELQTKTLFGRAVGIHGFGRVARALVALLRPFGVRVSCFSHHLEPGKIESHGVCARGSLDELFAGSEILFECESLTQQSYRSIGSRLLGLLPDDAVFVNVGRGLVVDEAALLDQARRGRIRVAVDVVTNEPANGETPLGRARGVLVSPHIGGPTLDRYKLCGELGLQNIRRYRAGLLPTELVDLSGYDRAT